MSFLTKIFGDYSSKEVKRVKPIQQKVLSYEDEYSKLTDEQLRAKTDEFKKKFQVYQNHRPCLFNCGSANSVADQ